MTRQVIDLNIEAYDAESLRRLVRFLEYENRLLKDKLKKENIPYDEVNPFEETIDNAEEYDPDQGERIVYPSFITEEMAIHFQRLSGKRCKCNSHNYKSRGSSLW